MCFLYIYFYCRLTIRWPMVVNFCVILVSCGQFSNWQSYHIFFFILHALTLKCIFLGSEKYGDCLKYRVGELKPVLLNGDRFCLTEKGYEYCKEFTCPPAACEQPLVTPYNKCLYCTGKFKQSKIAQFLIQISFIWSIS